MARGGARPGAGRKPISNELKKLRGTDRADRQGGAGEPPPDGPMIYPMHLSDLAQLIFADIADMLEAQNRSSPHFAQHVALLAQRLEQVQRYQAVVETEGDTFTTESARKVGGKTVVTKMVRARPEVAMLSDAMRHAQSLLGELMLNPAAAMKLIDGRKPAGGDFDDF